MGTGIHGEVLAWPTDPDLVPLIDEADVGIYNEALSRNEEGFSMPGDLFDMSQCNREEDCTFHFMMGVIAYPSPAQEPTENIAGNIREGPLVVEYQVNMSAQWNDSDLDPPSAEDAIEIIVEDAVRSEWRDFDNLWGDDDAGVGDGGAGVGDGDAGVGDGG